MNISLFENAKAALDLFLSPSKLIPQPDSLFRDDWQERINTFLHAWLRERQLSLNLLTRDHKRELVLALHADNTQSVKRGQPLIDLDPATTAVQMDAAEAALGRAVRAVRAGCHSAALVAALRRPV